MAYKESQGRTVLVVWATEEAKPTTIPLTGRSWNAIDLQGNQLDTENVLVTERPVYLTREGTNPEQLPWQ